MEGEPMIGLYDCRDAYAAAITKLAAEDPRVGVVVNDSVGSSNLAGFAAKNPDRVVNVGIAEQDMVGVAAGLASSGLVPIVSAAACFLTARALEQIKVDAAYSRLHITFCGMSPGLAYGELGSTHHSVEDVAWLRAIPGMTVIVPSDPPETAQALRWAVGQDGPVFIRISRMLVPLVNRPGHVFEAGRAVKLRDGGDVTVIANGTVVWRALEAARQLSEEGIELRVLSMPTVKPLDVEAVVDAAVSTGGVVTAEEGSIVGGLGGAVAEVISTQRPVPMRIIGVPDVFAPTGSEAWLMDRFGISAAGIGHAARDVVGAVRSCP